MSKKAKKKAKKLAKANNVKAIKQASNTKFNWLLPVLIVLTFIGMYPVIASEFHSYDSAYCNDNPMVLGFDVGTMFSSFYLSQYSPIAMVILAILVKIFGASSSLIKIAYILFHAISAVLVFKIIEKLFDHKMLAFFTAACFALSPLQVEAVAWLAASMKFGPYGMFFLGSLWLYLRYVEGNKRSHLIGSLVLFVSACLSKEQAVALAPTLVLIDYIKGRKLLSKQVLMEKLPYFLFGLAFGILTLMASKSGAIAQQSFTDVGVGQKLFFSLYAIGFYLVKLIIPFDLSFFYLYPNLGEIPASYFIYLVVGILAIGAFLWMLLKKRNDYILFGLGFFFINIFLSLFTQILSNRPNMIADRYVYISSIGVYLVIGGLIFWNKKMANINMRYMFAGVFSLGLLITCFLRGQAFETSFSLFSDAVKKDLSRNQFPQNPDLAILYSEMGLWNKKNGNMQEGLKYYNEAIAVNSQADKAYSNRASLYFQQGDYTNALQDFDKAISIDPHNNHTQISRAALLGTLGKYDEAINELNRLVEVSDAFDIHDALLNRAAAFLKLNKFSEALSDLNRLSDKTDQVYFYMAICQKNLNDIPSAKSSVNRAIQLNPSNKQYQDFKNQM